MKLSYQQLEQHVIKNLATIYLLSSDELLLVQDAVEIIHQAAQKAGFSERTLITADNSADWTKALQVNTQSLSLFSSKQLIELNMHHIKFNASTTKALQEYVTHPQKDVMLLIRTNKIDSKTEKSAWFKTLEKNSVFISMWPIPPTQLPQWIMQRAKKQGLTLTKNTAELVATQSEGNLLAAAQEIEKYFLLQLSSHHTNTLLQNDSTINQHSENDYARFTVFDLVDSMLAGNHNRSIRILRNLAAEDIEPTLILWALTRELRIAAEIQTQIKRGITLATLFSQFRIFEKRQASVRAFLQRTPLEKCWKRLLQAARVDRTIKGMEPGNSWNELEKLVVHQ